MKEVDLSNPDVVRYVVKRFGLRMNKKLGQNFLIRHAVVDDIADAAEIGEGDPVLEIGPGIGTLTQALAETGAAVTAVELDDHLLPVLDKTLEHYETQTFLCLPVGSRFAVRMYPSHCRSANASCAVPAETGTG